MIKIKSLQDKIGFKVRLCTLIKHLTHLNQHLKEEHVML